MRAIRAIVGARITHVVESDTTVRAAAKLMTEHHIGAVPVMDRGRLLGIFTERDLMTRVVAPALDPDTTPVSDVMSAELLVAAPDDDCESCVRRMQQARVRHLPILERGVLAGIVSLRDLLDVELAERDEAIMLLNAYVNYVPADAHARA